MSLSRGEFDKSLAAFEASVPFARRGELDGPDDSQAAVSYSVGSGVARVGFREVAPKTFGGLLKLPRAEVSIGFDEVVPEDERRAFVAAFDLAFQRGGG